MTIYRTDLIFVASDGAITDARAFIEAMSFAEARQIGVRRLAHERPDALVGLAFAGYFIGQA